MISNLHTSGSSEINIGHNEITMGNNNEIAILIRKNKSLLSDLKNKLTESITCDFNTLKKK